MIPIQLVEQKHSLKGCHRSHIQELIKICDHEYYMSVLPVVTNKKRAVRGYSRITDVLKEFKQLLKIVECEPCSEEINNQVILQEKVLVEIETVWNIIKND